MTNTRRQRQTKLTTVMQRKAFRLGFEDKRKDRWRGDDLAVLDTKGSAWSYERGRLFAAACPHMVWTDVKQGRRVTREAVLAYIELQREKVLI